MMMSTKTYRNFSTTLLRCAKAIPKNLKGKSKSSQEWLIRQLSDPYVEKARMENFRCRSAFKLIEIDDKYKVLRPGNVIIDCGAAPGSWTQIAVKRSNADGADDTQPKGTVLAVDLLQIYPIPGATIFSGNDFTDSSTQEKIRKALEDKKINCVLSDMAPNATGVRGLDQEKITSLCYSVLKFALEMSASGAHLLIKIWDNGDVPKLEKDILKYYERVRRVKPNASRSDSSEHFLLAKNFKGL